VSCAQRSSSSLLADEIAALEDLASERGVHLEIDLDDDLWISRIDRLHGAPGSGSAMIRKLCEIADEWCLAISLACQDGFLEEYYSDLGFERDSGKTSVVGQRDDDMIVMVRQPES